MEKEKNSFNLAVLYESGYVTRHIKIPKALMKLFEDTFYNPFTSGVISELLDDTYDKKLIKEEWDKRYIHRSDFFLNALLQDIEDRDNIMEYSVRICKMDWDFINAVMPKTPDNQAVSRGRYSNIAFFVAFLIYAKQRNICLTKNITCLSQPALSVLGNKYWFKQRFCKVIGELIKEKSITRTVELFGGSGILTCFAEEYCRNSHLPSLKHIYNDIHFDKRNFIQQLKSHPESFRKKCKLLVSAYDSSKDKKKFKKNVESCLRGKTISSAAAFWFLSLFNNQMISKTKIDALEEFVFASSLYQNVEVVKNDVFYCLKKYQQDETAFIIADPPYMDGQGYQYAEANKDFPRKEQERLCKELLLRTKAVWIYHGRPSPSKNRYAKEDEQLLADKAVQRKNFLDDNLQNKGVFYLDVPLRDNIERIVSNYQFEGFKPYVKEANAFLSIEVEKTDVTASSLAEAEETDVTASPSAEAEETAFSPEENEMPEKAEEEPIAFKSIQTEIKKAYDMTKKVFCKLPLWRK